MATQTVCVPSGVTFMSTTNLKPENEKIVRQIILLRKHTLATGFQTGRTVNIILGRLDADDLIEVLEALEQAGVKRPNLNNGSGNSTQVRRYDPNGHPTR